MTSRIARLALAVSTLAAADRLGAQQLCRSEWSPARSLLASSGAPAYVDAPAQLTVGDARLLIGTPAYVWAAPGAFMPSVSVVPVDSASARSLRSFLESHHLLVGFTIRRDGRVDPLPAPGWAVAPSYPLAVSDGTIAHLLWTSKASGGDGSSSSMSMWTSELAGRQWSRPILLWTARLIYPRVSAVTLASHGIPMVLVPVVDSARSGFLFARRIAGVWRASLIRNEGFPSFVTALPLGADSLLVAYTGTERAARRSNGSHVFVAQIEIRDSVWSRSTRVQWSGLGAARSPALFRLKDGRVVLTWATVRRGASAVDSVVAMTSNDDGRTWSAPAALAVPATARSVAWQVGDVGDVHAVIAGRATDEETTLLHASWHQQGWSPMDSIVVPRLATQFSLTREGSGELRLSWGSLERAGSPDGATAPVGRYAVIRTSCE